MERRIVGIETEFGLTYSRGDGPPLGPDEVARHLFRSVVQWGRSSNVFLPNGARLYLDVGSHPEYATAECDRIEDLIAQDGAGELILNDLREQAQERLRAEGYSGAVYLFKNNTDSAGNSYGSHENYLIPRSTRFARLSEILIPFLVTRQLIAGAGRVITTPSGPRYAFSQRADHIWESVSSATTRSRPIINTRDEPHADAEHYRRLHVISGDSSMSQATTRLKIVALDLLLRMIEEGVIMRDLKLENPIRSIRDVSHDLTGRGRLKLADGSTASALELQRYFLESVIKHVAAKGSRHADTDAVFDLWARALDAVEEGDATSIDTEIDWAIKKKLIDSWCTRNDADLSSPRVAQIDLTYHDIDRARSPFHLLRSRGLVQTLIPDDELARATDEPPATTRAKLRGDFVRAAIAAGKDHTVDWVHLKLNEHAQQTILCKDPFRAQDDRVDELIASITPAAGGPDPDANKPAWNPSRMRSSNGGTDPAATQIGPLP